MTLTLKTANHLTLKTANHLTVKTANHLTVKTANHLTVKTANHLTVKTANHLTVKTANQSLRKIIWLKMMHHHNKFVCKRYSDSDGMIWTNIHNILKFCYELGREHLTIQFLNKTLWLTIMYDQTKFSSRSISCWEDVLETIIFWSYRALAVTLTLKIANQSFCMTLRLMMMHHNTRFGNKIFCGLEDIIWTNIHWHFEPSLWPWP